MGILSTGKYLYLYLYLLYKALVNILWRWKLRKDAGEDETSPVWYMHVPIPKGIVSLPYGGSCSFPWWWCLITCSMGLGSLCKILDVLQLFCLPCYFHSGTHQLSLVGMLLLTGCWDRYPWVLVNSHICVLSRFSIRHCHVCSLHRVWVVGCMCCDSTVF